LTIPFAAKSLSGLFQCSLDNIGTDIPLLHCSCIQTLKEETTNGSTALQLRDNTLAYIHSYTSIVKTTICHKVGVNVTTSARLYLATHNHNNNTFQNYL
jgi:hypothetical protein